MIHNTQYAAGGGELASVVIQLRLSTTIFDYQGVNQGSDGAFQVPVNTVVVISSVQSIGLFSLEANGMAEVIGSDNGNPRAFLVTGDCSFSN